jgi:hypothetical protein
MGTLTGTNSAQLRIQNDLADVLERCHGLRGEANRQMLADLLSDMFGEVVSLHGQTGTRMQLLDLVRQCCKRLAGLHILAKVVAVVEPQAPEVPVLTQLSDEWDAAEALPTDDWENLRDTLLSVRLAEDVAQLRHRLRGIVRQATGGRIDLPAHCASVWATFVHLAGANSPGGSLPPAIIFLQRVADLTGDLVIAERLRDWIREWDELFGLAGELYEPTKQPADVDQSTNAVHLVFLLEPNPTDQDSFVVAHWRHWDAKGWVPQRLGDTLVRRDDLEHEIDAVIAELETELGKAANVDHLTTICLEFVVPWDFLNTPIEFWRKQTMSDDTVPLAVDHPVVLMSLDRLRAARHRLAWRQRWASLSEQSIANRPYWSKPSGVDYFTMLSATLEADDQIVSLVLSEPPGSRDGMAWREAAMAFKAGIPAVIWDREDCSATHFRDAVDTMLKDGAIFELPQRVAELRRDALRLSEPHHHHAGHSIAILFDDPDRLPEPPSSWWNSYPEVTDGV